MRAQADSSPLRPSRRILIVEDEFLIALSLEDMLVAAACEVVGIAATFDEALAIAAEKQPDLVLMDIQLASERDGVDAAIEIRRVLGIPSLFTSANIDPENSERARAAHPLGWLPKPYSPDSLTASVNTAFRSLEGGGATT